MANRRGRPSARIIVSPSERATLEHWVRRRVHRPRIGAARADCVGLHARPHGCRRRPRPAPASLTVGEWRRRFQRARLEGLLDEPRPGAPRRITDAMVERVITETLESTPRDATHWSTRSMAKATGLSQSAVARIWKAFALQPHRVETFKLSKDPLFIDKVRDIVGLYLAPPDRALVLCVDESQIQRSIAPPRPAVAAGPSRTADA